MIMITKFVLSFKRRKIVASVTSQSVVEVDVAVFQTRAFRVLKGQ